MIPNKWSDNCFPQIRTKMIPTIKASTQPRVIERICFLSIMVELNFAFSVKKKEERLEFELAIRNTLPKIHIKKRMESEEAKILFLFDFHCYLF